MLTCEPCIDATAAAKILNMHPVTVCEMAALHKIPAIKMGRVWKFRASSLDEFLRRQLDSSLPPDSPKE